MNTITLNTSEVIYREDMYPRFNPDPARIQQYADNIDRLPPIEINQHNELIDGYHRWKAHQKEGIETIACIVTHTTSDLELLALATERNAVHGLQLSREEKRSMARKLYGYGDGLPKDRIAEVLGVSGRTIANYLKDIDRKLKEDRDRKIFEMWLACHTLEEIAETVDLTHQSISKHVEDLQVLENLQKVAKLSATYQEDTWKPPLYNVWTYGKKSNSTGHFGNTEQSIVDNLLYLFTEPFEIVVDPFGGGGSTIDVCQHRARRYWVSDRLVTVEREHDMRQHDILEGVPPLYNRWGDVALLYLDPPYWKQAAGQYSEDAADLANMELEEFYHTLVVFIESCAGKMRVGSHIALIIQPTQWLAPDRHFIVDHVFDLVASVNRSVLYKQRVICPYQSEQYNPQQVNWAKENREVLTLNRELIIWQVVE